MNIPLALVLELAAVAAMAAAAVTLVRRAAAPRCERPGCGHSSRRHARDRGPLTPCKDCGCECFAVACRG